MAADYKATLKGMTIKQLQDLQKSYPDDTNITNAIEAKHTGRISGKVEAAGEEFWEQFPGIRTSAEQKSALPFMKTLEHLKHTKGLDEFGAKRAFEEYRKVDPEGFEEKYGIDSYEDIGNAIEKGYDEAKGTIEFDPNAITRAGMLPDFKGMWENIRTAGDKNLSDFDITGTMGVDTPQTQLTQGPMGDEMWARPNEGLASIGPHGFEYGNQWQKPEQQKGGNWLRNIASVLPFVGKNTRSGAALRMLGNKFMPGEGIGNFANTMRGGLTQRGYEQERDARRRQSRIDYMLDRRGAGKDWGVKNLNQLTMGSRPGFYDNVPTYDLPQKQPVPSRPVHGGQPTGGHHEGGGGGIGSTASKQGPAGGSIGASRFRSRGGLIGSVGGTSRQKYQGGEIVGAEMEGAEMEGAEMEGAVMESQEVIKELYEALIAQGLSPQAAMEKIKEIIASTQAEEPESPMMGEELPGQEFSRAPAAFGGIMDTYTGRRKYGLGSFIKKAFKKVKKLASSKVGKIALMYAAGTYLGGMQGFGGPQGGMGWEKFGHRLLNPMSTEGGIGNVGRKAMNLVRGSPQKATSNLTNQGYWQQVAPPGTTGKAGAQVWREGIEKAVPKSLIPGVSNKVLAGVAGPSIAAGLYTAAKPPEELGGEVMGEYDDKKAWWDNYLANLDSDYSVNPDRLQSAQGGRIGRQEGGLMNLGGMEKDYRNDGGFVPLGGEEKADDVPARLSKNEFVFTADAVRNAGGGDIDRGAEVMENVMKNLEAGGKVSEESQGQGAQEMFETSERLSEVI